MPLRGKFWLIPQPLECPIYVQVIDTSATEHAVHAKKVLLGLEDGDPEVQGIRLFQKLDPKQVSRFRTKGVPGEILNFLRENADPRWYVIERFNWIRVAHATFNVWKFDLRTVEFIRSATEYWKTQAFKIFDMMDFVEISSKKHFTISVRRLNDIKTEEDALGYLPLHINQE